MAEIKTMRRKIDMNKLLTIALLVLFMPTAMAYSGQTPTNLTVILNSTAVYAYNNKINHTSTWDGSSFQYQFNWSVDYEYNLSGFNVTVISYNYSQNCPNNYSDELANIKNMMNTINCSKYEKRGEEYYSLYLDCFTNLTICSEFRKTAQNYQANYDSCNLDKNNLLVQNQNLLNEVNRINNNQSTCAIERDNFSAQRWIFSLFAALATFVVAFFIFKVYPKEFRGNTKFALNKEMSSSIDVVHPDKIQSKPNPKSTEILNPDNINRGG